MSKLSLILLFINIFIATIGLGFSGRVVFKTPVKVSKNLFYLLLFFNLWQIEWLLAHYFRFHVFPLLPEQMGTVFTILITGLGATLGFAFIFFYFYLLADFPKPFYSIYTKRAAKLFFPFLLVLILFFVIYDIILSNTLLNVFQNTAFNISHFIMPGFAAFLYMKANRVEDVAQRKAYKLLFFILIGFFLVNILPRILLLLPNSQSYLRIFSIFDTLADNWFTILGPVWIIKYTRCFIEKENRGGKTGPDFTLLKRKFGLSKRELEIAELVFSGKTNQEIADQLFISLKTVKGHVYNIFKKTGVGNRTQLANLISSGIET